MARLVVFDLDGTLVDSARDIAAAVNAALAALEPGTAPLPLERVVGFVGDGARLLIERVLQHRGSSLRPDRVLPLYLEAYRERLLDTTRLYPGVSEALAELAASGRPLAVLTNKPGDLSRTILNGLGVGSRFARIWGAGDVPARKPDPAGLRALLGRARCRDRGGLARRRLADRRGDGPRRGRARRGRRLGLRREGITGGRTGPFPG